MADWKKQTEQLINTVQKTAVTVTETVKEKADRMKKKADLKKQIKSCNQTEENAYMEIGKEVVLAKDELREAQYEAWLEQIHAAREMREHLEHQIRELDKI